jgi:putative nucleotidyltransferase with HDIG domain
MIDLKHVFEEFDKHLLEDDEPSKYFEAKLKQGLFNEVYPLTMLGALVKTPQSVQHHPEGNVWIHTMMVVDKAAKHKIESGSPRIFMWAALLHDLGKPDTTKTRKGKITAYDHDRLGERLAVKFLTPLTEDKEFIDAIAKMVRWHMQTLFVVKDMPFADIDTMLKQVKLEEIALLTLCDRLGRGKMTAEKEAHERENIAQFIKKSRSRCGST